MDKCLMSYMPKLLIEAKLVYPIVSLVLGVASGVCFVWHDRGGGRGRGLRRGRDRGHDRGWWW